MLKSEYINELSLALSKAQGEMKFAIKDSTNPYFKSKYADLTSVWDVLKQPLSNNGLSVSQVLDHENGNMVLTTLLLHSSGQYIGGSMPLIPAKTDPQTLGSLISYMRRYMLSSICGVTADDDDGALASDKPALPTQQASKAPITKTGTISAAQSKLLWNDAKVNSWDEASLKKYVLSKGFNSLTEITSDKFNEILAGLKNYETQKNYIDVK